MSFNTQCLACSPSQKSERSGPILREFSPRTTEAMHDDIIGCLGAKPRGETFRSSPDQMCRSTWISADTRLVVTLLVGLVTIRVSISFSKSE